MLLEKETNELNLPPDVLFTLLNTMITGRDMVRLVMVNRALFDFILSDAALRERYWKTKTRHYFHPINPQPSCVSNLSWEIQFAQLQEDHHGNLPTRLASLFLAARSSDIKTLHQLKLTLADLYKSDNGNIVLYDVIAKSRHQPIKDYVFARVVMPNYIAWENNQRKVTPTSKNETKHYNILHHIAMLNQRGMANAGQKPITTALLSSFEEPFEKQPTEKSNPLYLAAQYGHDTVIQIWVEVHGADPNRQNDHGYTALHEAARAGQCASINTLLRLGANINASRHAFGFLLPHTPLELAAYHGHAKAFHLLIQRGAKPPASQQALLNFAIHGGSVKILNTIMTLGNIDINAPIFLNAKPLECAISARQYFIFEKLLALGADPNANQPETLLHLTARCQNLPMFELAAKHMTQPVNFNARNSFNHTPLHEAIASSNNTQDDVALALIAQGADLDVKTNQGQTPLHYAAMYHKSNSAIIDMLMEHGATVQVFDKKRCTPLEYWLVRLQGRHTEQLDLFIKKGATLNHQVKSISALNFSDLEIPLHILIKIVRKTPYLSSLNLKNAVITIDPRYKRHLTLKEKSLFGLRYIDISGIDLPSVLLLKPIFDATSWHFQLQLTKAQFKVTLNSNAANAYLKNIFAQAESPPAATRTGKKAPAPHTHTTLFAQPQKRSSGSEHSAAKHLKI